MVLDRLSQAAGRRLSIDQSVYESERRTGHRNRAIAHLLLNFGMVHDEAEDALDVYFRQCSILVTCRDLALIGRDARQHGAQSDDRHGRLRPRDRARACWRSCSRAGCTTIRASGRIASGVPAKSGVSGGVMAVVNRQLGIATYSPRLDARGNSCRGIEVCADLAARFGLHAFDCLNVGSSFLDVVI